MVALLLYEIELRIEYFLDEEERVFMVREVGYEEDKVDF